MRTRLAWFLLVALVLGLALSGEVRAQGNSGKKEDGKESKAGGPKAATDDPAYVIGEQDVLDINVWNEGQISRSVPVRPDGKISLPLVNDVQAAGLTPTQLSMVITEKLRKFLAEPQVTVIVTAVNSRRIYIVGEAGRAGAYPMLPNMTVLQALASAGGFSQFADLKNIYILRVENGKQIRYPFNYKEVLKGNRPEQNITLKPGDTIVVP